ncbi:MAG TPA: alpha/beta hydrolase-fold protein [Lysobacter sp.]|nr:alpha/beta hydrolase-fold protein [Lysobacter sp.]
MHSRLQQGCLFLLAAMGMVLAACTARGDVSRPIPTALILAPQAAQRLVVVLPGRADDLDMLQRGGIAEAVHQHWPDADVLLAELTMPYYLQGTAPQRLHDEVIAPARRRGYREVWLSGASMGGMGSVMYDRSYPGEVDGIILLAPYLGDRPILREIAEAGGVERWDPGPPQAIGQDNWQHEMWRHLQTWADSPDRTRNVWLAYGERDRLRSAMPLLVPLLPPEQVLVRPGGHAWRVWSPALGEVLQAASTARESAR